VHGLSSKAAGGDRTDRGYNGSGPRLFANERIDTNNKGLRSQRAACVMNDRIRRASLALLLVAGLTACAATRPEVRLNERLDERTGSTITTLDRPLEFFAPQPERGIDAASFADLGLAEVNTMGTRSYYLWTSVLWGRTDPNKTSTPRVASIAVESERDSLLFKAAERIDAPGHVTLYAPQADWSEQIVCSLTVDQVRAIATAQTLTLTIAIGTGESQRFTLWKPPTQTLPRFAAELLDGTSEAR
jgi:hypothetical protein